MRAQFFDLDTLIKLENKAWFVDKTNPNTPILKISQSDFNIIKSGIFRKQNNKLDFNGETFWLPQGLYDKLKVKVKNYKIDISNIGISLQEFLNKGIIDDMNFEFTLDNINVFKNSLDDIYIICSKQTKSNYESIISKLEEELKENGIVIKKFYHISENFYNQKNDDIKYKKIKLLLQHLIGYKTEVDKFIDEEISRYDIVNFHDNNYDTLVIADQVNDLLNILMNKTDDGLRSVIKEDIKMYKPVLVVNQISDNYYNKVSSKKINIGASNIIKTFEGFNNFKISEKILNREQIFINGYEYWIDKEKNPIMLYDTVDSNNGISIESIHWTRDEKRQIMDFIKYH